ncbi:MAG: exopolysaccharide biosynthesis protein [Hydrogenophaga sp.]|uniref:exopolysaccharide biosynthesis protein n=1 Tax=Hydrogenophaga sp. TaxID=1904254 RepID=UPI003D9B8AB1
MKDGMAQRLRAAGETDPTALRLTLRELLQLHGEASGAVLLMVMALLSTLPVAGAGTVLSLGIFALAWAWLRGRDSLQLPEKLAAVQLNEIWTRRCLHSLAWTYERAERWLRPRWTGLSHASTRVWWALWIALMAALIFLPLPLGNLLPGTSLMLLSLGWLFRDGLALLVSAATGVVGVGYAVSMGHLAFAAWQHAGAWIGL